MTMAVNSKITEDTMGYFSSKPQYPKAQSTVPQQAYIARRNSAVGNFLLYRNKNHYNHDVLVN